MTAFTGTPTALYPAGHKLIDTEMKTWYDALAALTSPWTDYSASIAWTGSTTNPAKGNATIASAYMQAGKLVIWQGSIFMGSTTTYGSGTWQIGWPVAPAAYAVTNSGINGTAFFHDNSGATARQAGICQANGTSGIVFYPGGGALGVVTQAVPFTWAVSDRLIWSITYPAA